MDSAFLIVGWKEWVGLPSLNLVAIKAKIDTGAATSSVHAYNIKYVKRDGELYVKYFLHPIQKSKKVSLPCVSRLVDERMVKSSSGQMELRPVIKTILKLGDMQWDILLNLTNRDSMGMRMLIGREALEGRVLVNPKNKFLHGKFTKEGVYKMYKRSNSK